MMWRPGREAVGWGGVSGERGGEREAPFQSLRGGDRRCAGAGGLAKRQPGLPRSAGVWPGDMMMDWVSPRLRGDAAAHSLEAVRVALHDKAGGG